MEFTLAIIAGGTAKRLGGVTKALIEVDGRSVLSRLLALAGHAPVLVVSDRSADFAGLRCVGDVEPGRGAPGGLVSALVSASTPWVLVVAGDMPFLEVPHRDRLVERASAGDVEVVIATRAGRAEPLFGLYRSALGASWRPLLRENPSVRDLIATVPSAAVEFDPRALDSLNAPEDLVRVNARHPNR